MVHRVKHLSAMQETQVQSLGREDPLEKEMTTHSNTIAWKIPWTEEPGRLQFMGVTKSRTRLSDFTFTFTIYMRWPQTLKDMILESQCFLPETNVTAPGLAASRKDTDLPPGHEQAIHCPILALGGLTPTQFLVQRLVPTQPGWAPCGRHHGLVIPRRGGRGGLGFA